MGNALVVFFSVFISVCIAEMGDKTQLFVIGLSAKNKAKNVLTGITIATILLNLMGVFIGRAISNIFPYEYVTIAAGFLFLIFALLTIGKDENATNAKSISVLGIAVAFFLAELGDKTQLSAIAFSANFNDNMSAVFLGATCGMIASDGLGILVAKLMNKRIPESIMKAASYLIFAFFGFKTLVQHFMIFLPDKFVFLTISIAALFVLFSFILFKEKKAFG